MLVFHRVTDEVPEDGITIKPIRFREIILLLKKKYLVISASELLQRLRTRVPFTGREVVITFDDGYRDNATVAAPLLEDAGLPAIFFLTAGLVGTERRFPWDSEKGVAGPLMSWDEAAGLRRRGFEIGCHTWSHPDLGREPIENSSRELLQAKRLIESRTGGVVHHFAYPFGGRSNIRSDWVRAAQSFGFESLFCGFGGAVTADTEPYWIARMGASHQRSLTGLRIDLDQAW